MWKYNIILIFMLCKYVCSKTDNELKQEFAKIIMRCTKDHPVEMQELIQLQKLITPKQKDTKCLLACAYRKVGSLDDKGMYDLKKAYELAEATLHEDPKRLANGKELSDICSKVNELSVSDGEKGCDRAALLFKCVMENAPKLGFKV